MKIRIPTQTENNEKDINKISEEYITKNSGLETENTIEDTKKEKEEKLDINKATQEELETLSGIGPSTANKIIQYRKDNGNFKNIEDLKNVNGIGESKYNEIKEKIIVKK